VSVSGFGNASGLYPHRQNDLVENIFCSPTHTMALHLPVQNSHPYALLPKYFISCLAGSDQEVRIRHTPNAHARLEQAYKLLGLTNVLYRQLEAIFNRMAITHISDKKLLEYVNALIPIIPKPRIRQDAIISETQF